MKINANLLGKIVTSLSENEPLSVKELSNIIGQDVQPVYQILRIIQKMDPKILKVEKRRSFQSGRKIRYFQLNQNAPQTLSNWIHPQSQEVPISKKVRRNEKNIVIGMIFKVLEYRKSPIFTTTIIATIQMQNPSIAKSTISNALSRLTSARRAMVQRERTNGNEYSYIMVPELRNISGSQLLIKWRCKEKRMKTKTSKTNRGKNGWREKSLQYELHPHHPNIMNTYSSIKKVFIVKNDSGLLGASFTKPPENSEYSFTSIPIIDVNELIKRVEWEKKWNEMSSQEKDAIKKIIKEENIC